ncbi:MAG: hypothetical protein ACOYNI_09470 [Acidimicrobiia bacterium]
MTRGSTARQLAPKPAPRAPQRRAQLAVVEHKSVIRYRFVRWAVRSVAVATVALLFFAVALHAEIAAKQTELQRVRAEVTSEQTRNGDLRLQVAQLASPERIIGEAERLGLVNPGLVTYLPSAGPTAQPESARGANDWSKVKPNLVPRP